MRIPSLVALTCREVVGITTDYLEGDMTSEDSARFEQHLYACTWCMTYLDQMRSTVQALDRLGDKPRAETPAQRAEAQATRERLAAMFRKLTAAP